MQKAINQWRTDALKIIEAGSGATESQRALAWRVLRQWGVR